MHGNTGRKRPDVALKNTTRTWSPEARAAIAEANKRRPSIKK